MLENKFNKPDQRQMPEQLPEELGRIISDFLLAHQEKSLLELEKATTNAWKTGDLSDLKSVVDSLTKQYPDIKEHLSNFLNEVQRAVKDKDTEELKMRSKIEGTEDLVKAEETQDPL